MANGQNAGAALTGAAAGAAGGPVGAAVGAIGGLVASIFGHKAKPKPPPPLSSWFTKPAHVAIIAGGLVGGVLIFVALKKK